MIKLENLCSGYKSTDILKNISTGFERGQITAIVGPNGSGKTTLLKSLIGMLPLSSGRITVDGIDIGSMKQKDKAKLISYLSQSQTTPDMTVGELVTHGRFAHLEYPYIYSKKDKEIARKTMERMGIIQLENFPLKTLSGGIRQAAYIGMALSSDSSFILLDEPTSYLDISNKKQLMNTLKALSLEGKGIIAVIHDLPLAMEYANKIAVLKDGCLIKQDTPEQLYLSGVINSVFNIELTRACHQDRYVYYIK